MSTSNYNQSKLATLKTYMLIAFIFNILAMIGFVLGGIWEIIAWATWAGVSYWGVYLAGYATGLIITGIVLLVFGIFSMFIFFTRIRKMYTAVNTGDIATLKSLNNMMWAILALIFAGVLPGIMLLISFGPINELGQAPPPPPPS
jgi:ABC-type multidrug transport system fused ATPase/permease subunit